MENDRDWDSETDSLLCNLSDDSLSEISLNVTYSDNETDAMSLSPLEYSEQNTDISSVVKTSFGLSYIQEELNNLNLDLSTIEGRENSFKNRWSSLMIISPLKCAENGFYLCGLPDKLKCYYCGLEITFVGPLSENNLTEVHCITSKQASFGVVCAFAQELFIKELLNEVTFPVIDEKLLTSHGAVLDPNPTWDFIIPNKTPPAAVQDIQGDVTSRLGSRERDAANALLMLSNQGSGSGRNVLEVDAGGTMDVDDGSGAASAGSGVVTAAAGEGLDDGELHDLSKFVSFWRMRKTSPHKSAPNWCRCWWALILVVAPLILFMIYAPGKARTHISNLLNFTALVIKLNRMMSERK